MRQLLVIEPLVLNLNSTYKRHTHSCDEMLMTDSLAHPNKHCFLEIWKYAFLFMYPHASAQRLDTLTTVLMSQGFKDQPFFFFFFLWKPRRNHSHTKTQD